jgi:hypothetical protein
MRTPKHLEVVRDDLREAPRVALETDEHERIELTGCSEQEVKAKLHDFLAWAS